MFKKSEVKEIIFQDIWSPDMIPECAEIPEESITSRELQNACGAIAFTLDGINHRNFYVPKKRLAPQHF